MEQPRNKINYGALALTAFAAAAALAVIPLSRMDIKALGEDVERAVMSLPPLAPNTIPRF